MTDPLAKMAQDGLRVTPFELPRQPGPAPEPEARFKFHMAEDMDVTGPEEWLVRGLLPRHGLAAIYGPPGCGKSFLSLDVAAHIAAGQDWFGRKVTQGGIVYIAAEAATGMNKRVKALRLGRRIATGGNMAFITDAPNLGTVNNNRDPDDLINAVRAQQSRLKAPISLIVVDTLARTMYGANENDASDMGAFITNAGRLSKAFNCLVVAVHHTGKDADRGMRGSSALHGACDVEWELRDNGGSKSVSLAKNKEGEDGLSWAFGLGIETVWKHAGNNLGVSSFGDDEAPTTSCYVIELAEPAKAETTKRPKEPKGNKGHLFKAFREAMAEYGQPLPTTPDYPHAKGVTRSDLRKMCDRMNVGAHLKDDKTRRSAFDRDLSGLAGDGFIVTLGEWVWAGQ